MEKSPEEVLLEELSSARKSVRVAAISRAAKTTRDPRISAVLLQLCGDPDREIVLFAKMALSRMQPASPVASSSAEITREMLVKPPKEAVPRILQKFRENPENVEEDLRPSMAEFLARHGGPEDTDILATWLAASTDNLAVHYIEALEGIGSQRLLSLLPGFLASPHPLVRGRAVATLNRLDPVEAQAHLSELLASENSELKLAGLRISFLFPFKAVASSVLTMLAEETDPDVFKASAMLLLSNPDPEIAYKLLELREILPVPQSTWINQLLGQLTRTLVAVGMLEEIHASPEGLMKRLKNERLVKFLADFEVQLSLGDPSKMASIENWLARNQENLEVARFIERLSANPATEDMYRRLMDAPTAKPATPIQATPDIRCASAEEKIRFLKALPTGLSADLSTWVRQEASNGPDSVRAAAIKALRTLPPSQEDLSIAESNLSHPHAMVASQAISLLEKRDAKRLEKHIPSLLNAPDPLICSRAVMKALKLYEGVAIKSVVDMLKSPNPATRAQAVNLLLICPFGKISTPLFAAVLRENNPNIARGLLMIVLSNPDPSVLASLDHLPPAQHQPVAMLISQTRTTLFKLLLHLDMITSEETPVPIPEPPAKAPEPAAKTQEPAAKTQEPPEKPPAPPLAQPGKAPPTISTPLPPSAFRAQEPKASPASVSAPPSSPPPPQPKPEATPKPAEHVVKQAEPQKPPPSIQPAFETPAPAAASIPSPKPAPVSTPAPPTSKPVPSAPKETDRAEKYVLPPRKPASKEAEKAEKYVPPPAEPPTPEISHEATTGPMVLRLNNEPKNHVAAAPVAVPKPYSVAGVTNTLRQREIAERKASKEKKGTPQPSPTSAKIDWWNIPEYRLGGGMAAILILGYVVFFWSPRIAGDFSGKDVTQTEGKFETSQEFKMGILCKLSGKVETVEPDKTIKFSSGGRKFKFAIPASSPVILGLESANVEIVPYRQTRSGDIMAKCYSIKTK